MKKKGIKPATLAIAIVLLLVFLSAAWVLQKGTEIGISEFVPLVCERNVVDDLDGTVKEERIYHMAGSKTPEAMTARKRVRTTGMPAASADSADSPQARMRKPASVRNSTHHVNGAAAKAT